MELNKVLTPILAALQPKPEAAEAMKTAVSSAIKDNQTGELVDKGADGIEITPAFMQRVWVYAGKPKEPLPVAAEYDAMVNRGENVE